MIHPGKARARAARNPSTPVANASTPAAGIQAAPTTPEFFVKSPSLRSRGFTVWDASSGVAGLSATFGPGVTFSGGVDERGPYIQAAYPSGSSNPSCSITFPIDPLLISTSDTIFCEYWAYLHGAVKAPQVSFSTAANNFTGSLLYSTVAASDCVEVGYFGGSKKGASIIGTGITQDTECNRCKVAFQLYTGAQIRIYRVAINPVLKPSLLLSFDDGTMGHFIYAHSELAKRDLRATFGIITSKVGTPGYMTWEMLREMYDYGHDIVSHSHNHLYANGGYGASGGSEGPKNQIAQSQTVSSGADFVLNGSIGGTAFSQPTLLYFVRSGNETAKRYQVESIAESGDAQTEIIVAPLSTENFTSTLPCVKVLRITALDGTAAALSIGLTHSYSEIYADYAASLSALRGRGFHRLKGMIWPGGQTNSLARQALSDLGFVVMRNIRSSANWPGLYPGSFRHICSYTIDLESSTNTDDLKAKKDSAISDFRSAAWTFHVIQDDRQWVSGNTKLSEFISALTAIATDVRAGTLVCPTFSEIAGG